MEVINAGNVLAIESDDDIPFRKTSLLCRAPLFNGEDENTALHWQGRASPAPATHPVADACSSNGLEC